MQNKIISIEDMADGAERVEAMRAAIAQLPQRNRNELKILFHLLEKVASHSQANKMTPTNLAVCIGPTLFQSNSSGLDTVANLIKDYGRVFE
jgi:hypothetical protein